MAQILDSPRAGGSTVVGIEIVATAMKINQEDVITSDLLTIDDLPGAPHST
ncbi:hypothetical protein [Pseudonocardia spinosispora]|uniref:hypothetical protein n=1 Tax=Pseudonocardia spinosispora TaxID=103441 RepID=UPI0003F50225|nr:hypothetical protein [Pseudonocardia spinosispora]